MFRSLRSSSSGNCLLLQTESTTVLIDCGIKTQRECRSLLDAHASRINAMLVSHAHGDHICYSSLRVLGHYAAPVHCHEDVLDHVFRKHIRDWASPPEFSTFAAQSFTIGDFQVLAVPLPHEPCCPTFGFVLRCGDKKIVVCTDFYDTRAIGEHLPDADFIFIEANHDPDLLRLYPNYASHFHLSNAKTANILSHARRSSSKPPRCVMLGHLSAQRNTELLATDTIRDQFRQDAIDLDFAIEVAPRYEMSEPILIH